MRHGQSEYNVLGLCNDDPGREVRLTELGRAQAEAAATELGSAPLERIYCSELPRTRETARIVNRYHRVPIQPHPALNDIRSGCDGLPVETYFRAIAHDRLNARCGAGETLLEHKRRVLGFVDWLERQPHETVLVVAHEETLRVLVARARGLGDEAMLGLGFRNCEWLRLDLGRRGP
jgi:broad specificity phosphatase PhoE